MGLANCQNNEDINVAVSQTINGRVTSTFLYEVSECTTGLAWFSCHAQKLSI
jgi:hypothetical protein